MTTISSLGINDLAKKYALTDFVETGTLHGDSVAYALENGFSRAWSIEINKLLYEQCASRFHDDKRITLLYGSSHKLLPSLCQVLSAARRKCLFWLDAHFPGADAGLNKYGDYASEEENMPILHEVCGIFSTLNENSVVIIDDMRCFADLKSLQYHDFDGHMKSLGERAIGCNRETLVKVTLDDIISLIPSTHSYRINEQEEGSLIIEPSSSTQKLFVI
jgi:hypothetical protein